MTRWQCPKCPYTTEQPSHVTAISHRCKPTIPRAYQLVQVPQQQEETPK